MIAKVSRRGLLIPREMLSGAKEVEIRQEERGIVILPLDKDDPICGLGTQPVECGIPDAAANHDKYLYGGSG